MNDSIFKNPENAIYKMVNKVPGGLNCAKVGKIAEMKDDGSVVVEFADGVKANCLLFCLAAASGFIDFEDYIGSDCLAVFCDADLTAYKMQNEALQPLDGRTHTLNNGIALSGVFPFGKRPKGEKHFVSYEELDEILTGWTGTVVQFQTDLLNALQAALTPGYGNPITWVQPLPQATEAIDISGSKIGGIVHNDSEA